MWARAGHPARAFAVIESRCEPMNSSSPECCALREAMRNLREVVAQMRAGTHFAARQRSAPRASPLGQPPGRSARLQLAPTPDLPLPVGEGPGSPGYGDARCYAAGWFLRLLPELRSPRRERDARVYANLSTAGRLAVSMPAQGGSLVVDTVNDADQNRLSIEIVPETMHDAVND